MGVQNSGNTDEVMGSPVLFSLFLYFFFAFSSLFVRIK